MFNYLHVDITEEKRETQKQNYGSLLGIEGPLKRVFKEKRVDENDIHVKRRSEVLWDAPRWRTADVWVEIFFMDWQLQTIMCMSVVLKPKLLVLNTQ